MEKDLKLALAIPQAEIGWKTTKSGLTQRALDWRVRAAFLSIFLALASSAKMALPHPTRQQVTQTVGGRTGKAVSHYYS